MKKYGFHQIKKWFSPIKKYHFHEFEGGGDGEIWFPPNEKYGFHQSRNMISPI